MNYTPFDWIVMIGGVCGLFMVMGGLILFYKGILTLDRVPDKEDAVTLEFKHLLKITSRYPAYGVFIFGLAFIISAAWLAKAPRFPPVKIIGDIENFENLTDPNGTTMTVSVQLSKQEAISSVGKISQEINPLFDQLNVEVIAPGSDPSSFHQKLYMSNAKKGVLPLEKLTLKSKVGSKQEVDPKKIADPPAGNPLPDISKQGAFK